MSFLAGTHMVLRGFITPLYSSKLQNLRAPAHLNLPLCFACYLSASSRSALNVSDSHTTLTAPSRAFSGRCMPVIFNDYMNTLMSDPTTAKELPLCTAR